MLVSVVLQQAAELMNDTAKSTYSYAVTLPYFKMAYRQLEDECRLNEVPIVDEVTAELTITAGTVVLNSGSTPPLPTDLYDPIYLMERLSAIDQYTMVERKSFIDPNAPTSTLIEQWAWREGEIKLKAASGTVYILIYYQKSLSAIVSESSVIAVPKAASFLAFKTAALCARYNAESPGRYTALNQEAVICLEKFLGENAKDLQDTPKRRRPFARNMRAF